jgi:hypothetical protein
MLTLFLSFSIGGFLKGKLIALLFAAIPVGAISFGLYQLVKRGTSLVDAIKNPWVHRTAVAVIAFVLTAAFAAVGSEIPCVDGVNCLAELTPDRIEVLIRWALGALSAFALHAVKGAKK